LAYTLIKSLTPLVPTEVLPITLVGGKPRSVIGDVNCGGAISPDGRWSLTSPLRAGNSPLLIKAVTTTHQIKYLSMDVLANIPALQESYFI
jgi:hypothetical protein